MAKIPYGILGPFIGKVGPVIGYMRGDTWCVRSMPMHYRDARTAAQMINRSKMTRLMQFLCSMKPVIRSSFDVLNSDNPCRTEFNMAFAENFHTALRTTARGVEILYHKVRIADGLLPGLVGAEAYRDGNAVHVCWSVAPFGMMTAKAEAMPGDRLCICAHNATTGESVWDLEAAVRGDGYAKFAIPEAWQNAPVHLWAWFSNSFTSSSSIYLGEYGLTSSKQGIFNLSYTYPGTSCHPSQEGTMRKPKAEEKLVSTMPSRKIGTVAIKVLPSPSLLRTSSLSQTTPKPPPSPPKTSPPHPQAKKICLCGT